MKLNTNNKQLAFQFKPKTNEYVLETITDTMVLSTDNIRLKYYEGQDLFCVDVGYSIDGDISKMSFKIDDLIVYPVVLKTPDKLQQQVINNQAIYIISEDYNFKSIIFIPIAQLNKTFEYTITSYNSCISSFVVDEIGRKFNSDVIYAEATQVSQTNEALGINVQTALDILNSRYMIPCYYEQLTDDNGNFLEEEEPANWYQALYGVTTVWELVHNTKSIVYRTEGTKSSVGRVNGLQPYGIKPLTGGVGSVNAGKGRLGVYKDAFGIFYLGTGTQDSELSNLGSKKGSYQLYINTSRQIKEYTDDLVVDNLLVRKWKLVSINGVLISDLLKQYLLNKGA